MTGRPTWRRQLSALPMLARSLPTREAVLLRRAAPGDAQRAREAGDEVTRPGRSPFAWE